MGCPASVTIGDNLVFSICTHSPDTGILTDADAAPTYRIYENETSTAILNGTMAKLDDTNTTGFYTELVACTAANGFEDGKTYTTYIEATVGGSTGGISYGFNAKTNELGSGAITFTYTLTSTVDSTPIADADVWVTTDVGGTNVIASGKTNANGVVTFYLDSGTYYFFRQKTGWDFVNPDIEAV